MFKIFSRESFTIWSNFSNISDFIKHGEVLKKYISFGIPKQCLSKKKASWFSISCNLFDIVCRFDNFGSKTASIPSGKIGAQSKVSSELFTILMPCMIESNLYEWEKDLSHESLLWSLWIEWMWFFKFSSQVNNSPHESHL